MEGWMEGWMDRTWLSYLPFFSRASGAVHVWGFNCIVDEGVREGGGE